MAAYAAASDLQVRVGRDVYIQSKSMENAPQRGSHNLSSRTIQVSADEKSISNTSAHLISDIAGVALSRERCVATNSVPTVAVTCRSANVGLHQELASPYTHLPRSTVVRVPRARQLRPPARTTPSRPARHRMLLFDTFPGAPMG